MLGVSGGKSCRRSTIGFSKDRKDYSLVVDIRVLLWGGKQNTTMLCSLANRIVSGLKWELWPSKSKSRGQEATASEIANAQNSRVSSFARMKQWNGLLYWNTGMPLPLNDGFSVTNFSFINAEIIQL